ncbi:MAG: DUF6580 family putative transport protein [Patescibacteria group bacterium]
MKKNQGNFTAIIAIILLTIGVFSRLVAHPANFVPVGALAFFAGIYLPRKYAYSLPLAMMFVSDLIIGFYSPMIMASVYIGFLLMTAIGQIVRNNKKFSTILAGVLSGSLLFFLITNAAVWAFGTMYTHNLSGLAQSYLMAIPFFRNSLMADGFYSAIFIGAMEAVIRFKKIPVEVDVIRNS